MGIPKMPPSSLAEVRSLSDQDLRERIDRTADRCSRMMLRLYLLQDERMRRSREAELASLRTAPIVEAVLL